MFWFYAYDWQSGCESYDSVFVSVSNGAADFQFNYDSCYTVIDVFFSNHSNLMDVFYWDFGDGENSVEINPQHTFRSSINSMDTDEYKISLVATNSITGCKDTSYKYLQVDTSFIIPNIVTPNQDGINDMFIVKGIDVGCWNLKVFNRWGILVFQQDVFTNDFEPINLPDGVYYYTLNNELENRKFKGYFESLK